jgi:hemoglobin/transferrin/lactoferrin receptor protein
MTTGGEFYHDKVNSSRTDFDLQANSQTDKRGLYPDNSTYWSLAFFNLHKFRFGKYIVDAGLRFNQYNIFVPEETLGDAEISPLALVWKAGISRKIGDFNAVGFNANKAFRAPNIDDMGTLGIVDFRYELPSDDLKPESSINLELNYKLNLRRFWFEAAIFRNNLTDFIQRTRATVDGRDSIDGYPIYLKTNSAEAYIQGFETNFKLLATDKLAVSGFLSYTYGQDETKDEPMRRIPPLNGMLSISYEAIDNLLIVPEFLFATMQDRLSGGDIDDNRIPEGGTPGWNVFNIYAQYSWSGFKFHLSLINLLDEDYRYHGSGVNMYGRSARVGVSYIYGS